MLIAAVTLIMTQAHGFQPPENATQDNLRVLRNNVSTWVPYAETLPTERLQVCVDDPAITIGSTKTCATRIPGRTDNWQLKTLAFPNSPSVTFTWGAVTQNTDGSPVVLAGYTVTTRHQGCDTALGNCPVADLDPSVDLVGPVLTYTVANVKFKACIFVQARTTGGDLGVISKEVCSLPPKILPNQVTDIRVVPPQL